MFELHYLAFEKIKGGHFAGFEISRRTRIRRNRFIAEFFNRAGVADLRQTFALDD